MKVTNLLFSLLIFASCSQIQFVKDNPVDSVLIKNRSRFQECYIKSDSYQNLENSIQGQVQIKFSIGPEGEVYNDNITQSDFKEAAFHGCLLKELRALRFLENKNEENLTQTLQFIQVKNEKL